MLYINSIKNYIGTSYIKSTEFLKMMNILILFIHSQRYRFSKWKYYAPPPSDDENTISLTTQRVVDSECSHYFKNKYDKYPREQEAL